MIENFDCATTNTENITVSAYQELLDEDSQNRRIWGYCLRIENNSDEPIILTEKKLCLTDERGHSYYDYSAGFNGELPDLQPGEYFEYEETTQTEGLSAVLYGFCSAITAKGKAIKIKLPVMNLSASRRFLIN